MRYTATDAGVAALNAAADNIVDASEEIVTKTNAMVSEADSNRQGLGPHVDQLMEALESISQCMTNSQNVVEEVSEKLTDAADAYQEIIDRQRFTNSGK